MRSMAGPTSRSDDGDGDQGRARTARTTRWRPARSLREVGACSCVAPRGTPLPSACRLLSAGMAFFAVLSIAPVLVTALSVYGAVNTPAQALEQLSRVAEMLPSQLQPIVADQLTSITTASTRVLTVRGLAGLVIALCTATTAMASLIDALTVAYHETETRGFLRRGVLAVAFVLGGALLLGAVISLAGMASRALRDAPSSCAPWRRCSSGWCLRF